MDIKKAYEIIGRANQCEPFLSNMIKALKLAPYLNTQEENERLEAAQLVKKDLARRKRNSARKERDSIMRDMGLVKVRGAVSGRTYWE